MKSLALGLILIGLGNLSLMAQTYVKLVDYSSTWKYNDSGLDVPTLAPTWKTVTFNEAGWESGPGPLGFLGNEPLQNITTIATTNIDHCVGGGYIPCTTQVRTYYFRTKFVFTNSTAGVVLRTTNLVDDGVIYYLNGTEVGRLGMPTTVVNYLTAAARADDIGNGPGNGHGIEVLELTNALVQGTNILAAEVHQGGTTSSDMVLGMVLWATLPATGAVRVVNQPQNQTVTVGQTATFRVDVTGTPPYRYQWRTNDASGNPVNITGANGQTYTTPVTTIAYNGKSYSCYITNAYGTVATSNALLTVNLLPFSVVRQSASWRYHVTGTDLGTAWRATNYNDAAWPSGGGPLGYETAAIPWPVVTTFANNSQLTYYFRSTFNFTNEPADVELVFTNEVDDGAAIYLNNELVLTVGMPNNVGPFAFGDAAGRTTDNAALEMATIPAWALIKGTNTLAVEAHQVNTTSSDLVMGLALGARFLTPSELSITNEPADQTFEELKPMLVSVGVKGNRPRYQWFKVNTAITATNLLSGATDRRYSVASADPTNSGYYFVVVSNVVNMVTSRWANIIVVPDTNGPVLAGADGTLRNADGTANWTNVLVSFNEVILATTATNTSNYKITNTLGGTLTVSKAVLTNATNVLLFTQARFADSNYLVLATGVRDVNPKRVNIMVPGGYPISTLLRTLVYNDNWQFYDPVPPWTPELTDPDWMNLSYNIGANPYWAGLPGQDPAPGAFGYNGDNNDLPRQLNTQLSQGYITKYFRRFFDFRGSPLGASLRLTYLSDDGVIVYLNDQEMFRYHMPEAGTPIDGNTPASIMTGVAGLLTTNIAAEVLRYGTNLFAVELHGTAANDLDWVFSLEMDSKIDSYAFGPVIITRQPKNQTVIEGQSVSFDFVGAGPGRFQWQRYGTNIPGATNAVFKIDAVPLSWSNSPIRVVASNTNRTATSSNAILTVLADTNRPVMLSAYYFSSNQVLVSFSEALSPTSAVAVACYRLTNAIGSNLVTGARITNGNQVVLTTRSNVLIGDILIANNLVDNSAARNRIATNSAVNVGFDGMIMPIAQSWRANASGTDLGTAWPNIGYNDSVWTISGPALLGTESAALPEPLLTAVPAPSIGGPRTTYYRTHFFYPGDPKNVSLTVRTILDDGAVLYLNGSEFFRIRVDAGQTYLSPGSGGAVGDAVYEGPFTVPVPSLRTGDNVLAGELHQTGDNSSDTVFGVELTVDPVPSAPIILPPPVPPFLRLTLPGGFSATTTATRPQVRIEWGGDGFVLQQASPPRYTNWANVPGQLKPYTFTPPAGSIRAYKLKPQ